MSLAGYVSLFSRAQLLSIHSVAACGERLQRVDTAQPVRIREGLPERSRFCALVVYGSRWAAQDLICEGS